MRAGRMRASIMCARHFWASRTMDVKVDIVRQEIGFLHDASLIEETKAQHSSSSVDTRGVAR